MAINEVSELGKLWSMEEEEGELLSYRYLIGP
jgi:hypothetical protein